MSTSVSESKYQPGQWGFSSDHLPVSAEVKLNDNDSFSVASFNVLNEAYKEYLLYGNASPGSTEYKRGQQLGGSELVTMSPETRWKENLKIIKKGLVNGLGIIGLQECSQKFMSLLLEEIGCRNEDNYDLLHASEDLKRGEDYGVIIFDKTQFQFIASSVLYYYNEDNSRSNYIHSVLFSHIITRTKFTFINTHIPFKKSDQFVSYILKCSGPVIAVGDFNLGYNDVRSESNLKRNLIDRLENSGYRFVENLAEFSHVNTEPVLDLFDHIIFKEMTLVAYPRMTGILRENFSLTNRK